MKINCLIIRYFSFPNSVEIFSHLLVDQLMSLEVLVWVYMAKILKKKLFGTAIPLDTISVKPFKSKNRDKIYLDAPNPNLKQVPIGSFSSNKPTYQFIGQAVARESLSEPFFRFGFGASRQILSRFFYLNGFTLGMMNDYLLY